jgi:hypothetical protein
MGSLSVETVAVPPLVVTQDDRFLIVAGKYFPVPIFTSTGGLPTRPFRMGSEPSRIIGVPLSIAPNVSPHPRAEPPRRGGLAESGNASASMPRMCSLNAWPAAWTSLLGSTTLLNGAGMVNSFWIRRGHAAASCAASITFFIMSNMRRLRLSASRHGPRATPQCRPGVSTPRGARTNGALSLCNSPLLPRPGPPRLRVSAGGHTRLSPSRDARVVEATRTSRCVGRVEENLESRPHDRPFETRVDRSRKP